MHGKEQKIDKPFGVLQRVRRQLTTNEASVIDQTVALRQAADETHNSTILDCTVAIEHKTKMKTEYFVRALVKKKLVFKSRPKPIIANVAQKV